MAKKRRNTQDFSQSFPARPILKTREKPPIPMPTKNGIELRCPFCSDHHQLLPNVESPCGTRIEVTAVQEVISAKLVRKENLICIKCTKPGGEMVRYRNSFIHAEECNPEVKFLQEEPKYSLLAKLVFGLPESIRKRVEKVTGRADQVLDMDNQGVRTGKVLGYFFWKPRKGTVNAKPRSA